MITCTPLESVLIAGALATLGAVAGGGINRWMSGNKCQSCGIAELRRDIRVQFFMIRHLAEKGGTTQQELLEIEAKASAMTTNEHK